MLLQISVRLGNYVFTQENRLLYVCFWKRRIASNASLIVLCVLCFMLFVLSGMSWNIRCNILQVPNGNHDTLILLLPNGENVVRRKIRWIWFRESDDQNKWTVWNSFSWIGKFQAYSIVIVQMTNQCPTKYFSSCKHLI